MWLGYYKLGNLELGNSLRASAYARNSGLTWVKDPEDCDTLEHVLPRLQESRSRNKKYTSVVTDPAPWYDPTNPDTEGFFGCMVLSVEGLYGSTRTVRMSSSVSGGAASGQTYFTMREMVMRVLLLAEDQCSLEAGTAWLGSGTGVASECAGVEMLFWDCCPCACQTLFENIPGEDDTIWDLALGTWDEATRNWDITGASVDTAEGTIDEQRVTWDQSLYMNSEGCIPECVMPYRRHMRNVQMTGGPTVIRDIPNLTCGAAREVEILLVAGDPAHYSDTEVDAASATAAAGTRHVDFGGYVLPSLSDRFGAPKQPALPHARPPARLGRTEWVRSEFRADDLDVFPSVLGGVLPVLRVSGDDVDEVRVSIRQGGAVAGSWYVPRLPSGVDVVLDTVARQARAKFGSREEVLSGVVLAGDGGPPRWPQPLGRDSFDVVVEKADDSPVRVSVDVTAVGAG